LYPLLFSVALFASLSIMSVLVSVVGVMVMLGWELGSIEATLIGIIAGFSVDYVVHLAHAYEIAKGDTYSRLTEAFGDLGISVFNGMITSVGASIPLFFCQLQFFAKFGTFLCLVIAFRYVSILVMFELQYVSSPTNSFVSVSQSPAGCFRTLCS
jgi:predicted RND superfamily exporter protein